MTLAMIQNFIVHNGIYSAKKLADSGDNQGAEKCYKDTLRLAMNIAGDKSVLAGTVFLELADFYELEGRDAEAEVLWDCLREVLICNMHKLARQQTL
jgi:hypothetical protein